MRQSGSGMVAQVGLLDLGRGISGKGECWGGAFSVQRSLAHTLLSWLCMQAGRPKISLLAPEAHCPNACFQPGNTAVVIHPVCLQAGRPKTITGFQTHTSHPCQVTIGPTVVDLQPCRLAAPRPLPASRRTPPPCCCRWASAQSWAPKSTPQVGSIFVSVLARLSYAGFWLAQQWRGALASS